jgi:hypothetical protein
MWFDLYIPARYEILISVREIDWTFVGHFMHKFLVQSRVLMINAYNERKEVMIHSYLHCLTVTLAHPPEA